MRIESNLRNLAMGSIAAAFILASTFVPTSAQTAPTGDVTAPRLEFVFEEVVTVDKAVEVGNTPMGHRAYVPITGGTVSGPKFKGKVLPGGWDWQLQMASGCGSLSANYMIQADDGTIINVSNKGFFCGELGARSFWSPKFEAPTGPYNWLNVGTFVDVLSVEGSPDHPAVRIRFYQVK
jgi:hypothetical protein